MMTLYPLAAVVGQEELKLGLLLNAVNPAVGGVLVRGEKGTAKSTAVRGMAELLPEIRVAGCRFSCDPDAGGEQCPDCCRGLVAGPPRSRPVRLVNLPLNAAEDRVVGAIDFSRAIRSSTATLQPGLLAEAHRGILYVDEVNLLDDHIVDLILDAAASGRNIVEREGISLCHPARFLLVGTMNPEEGELRPQLLDRFGLCVEVRACTGLDERVTLLLRRDEFDRDPASFRRRFSSATEELRRRIHRGRRLLPRVRVSAAIRRFIGELCLAATVAGHRADLVLEQAARALAALEGETEVKTSHVRRVAAMALVHRSREAAPPEPPPPGREREQEREQHQAGDRQPRDDGRDGGDRADGEAGEGTGSQQESAAGPETAGGQGKAPSREPPDTGQEEEPGSAAGTEEEQVFAVGPSFRVRKIASGRDRVVRRGSGRRSRSRVLQKQGRSSRSGLHGLAGDIALDATIRAAAVRQAARGGGPGLILRPGDLRYRIRERRIGNLLLFVVDASGSMGARGRMAASKGAVMSLLLDAYQKRDKVALLSFRRDRSWLNLPVTGSVELAGRLLAEMPVGGRTPLSAGLVGAHEQVRNYLVREPDGRPIVIILTDGKANVSLGRDRPVDEMVRIATAMRAEKRARYIVVDTEEEGLVTFGLAGRLAGALAADYFRIQDLRAQQLVDIVRTEQ